ncbi:hypothetical protein BDB00DRAFT_522316 [Zychaea mexicana]|uniref:uncharacterized protein n=1 Tax=Zychaea mexicana TaxID=64656 RepID=UPI0022FEF2D0|nr:uncharacterized protein BDB00DRAFT_522316 [Zychaea mexicana]KAI9490978.1 hypothetical protein BDB00DRAFT_522316 [Zychaea mexicana]
MYVPDVYEILSEINSVACVTAISLILGRKVASIDGPIYYVRGLLLVMYSLTLAFDIIACMLVSTNNGNFVSCILGFFNCVLLYTFAKLALYLYFIEKIYILSLPKVARLRSPIYWIGIGLLVPYIALITLMIINRVTVIEPEHPYHCTIGTKLPGVIPTLCYDCFFTLLCIAIFVKCYAFPTVAQQTSPQSMSLKIMAKRNIIVTVVACITATINYTIMIVLDGQERGLLALSITTLDITVVSCVVHWVTSHTAELQYVENVLNKGGLDKPMRLEIKQHQEVVVLTELSSNKI